LYCCFSALFLFFVPAGFADEFQDLTNSYGTTSTLIGFHHTTTTDTNGAGINFWLSSYEGATATGASLSNPHIGAADAYGNIYIADKASHSILKITTNGLVHTFAGTHVSGFNGDGPAPATNLQISLPNGIFVFPNGVVYLLDPPNQRIRRVDTNGIMTTVVHDPTPTNSWLPSGRALWVSPDETLIYYSHEFPPVGTNIIADGATLKKWTATGGIETVCSKAVGFRNPANIAVNPADGKLYVTDRAEEDTTRLAQGLFRIEGPDQRTRITGDASLPVAIDGALAGSSFIEQPRGIAFRPDGSYFICGHKDGNVWFVDTAGVLHKYLRGSGKKDGYALGNGLHPPLISADYFAQPRAVTLAPNGNLLVTCNDSGYVFQVNNLLPDIPTDFRMTSYGPDGVRLNWTGVVGRGYRLDCSTTLAPDSWQALGAFGGSPQGNEFVDPTPPTNSCYIYRLLPSL
jgi:DNA-binding beta-propeller fold protein YncE